MNAVFTDIIIGETKSSKTARETREKKKMPERKVGSVTYETEIPSRQHPLQIFHVNMLKK